MKKEVIIAIGAGFILGLIITFGVYTANRALDEQKSPLPELPSPNSETEVSPPPSVFLEIIEPENNLVVQDPKITVAGKTEPKAIVSFLAEEYSDLLTADEEGVFSAEIPLISGANEIKIITVGKSNSREEKTLTIVYTTAKIE